MKKVIPAKVEVNEKGNSKWKYEEGIQFKVYFSSWPVYKPYKIYEKTTIKTIKSPDDRVSFDKKSGLQVRYVKKAIEEGTEKWIITGDHQQYWRVWKGETDEGIEFINPMEEVSLFKDFRTIDIENNESILNFVNRYGLLGIDFLKSPVWITAQIPPKNFGVCEESLFEFQTAVLELQESYRLWKEKNFEKLLPILRRQLAHVREYPQIDNKKGIIPGKAGFTLLSYIWLHFYTLVIGRWAECKYCGNLFEMIHGNQKLCSICQETSTPRVKAWRKKQKQQNSKKKIENK